MISYADLYQELQQTAAKSWLDTLPERVTDTLTNKRHGLLTPWLKDCASLPAVSPSSVDLNAGTVRIGAPGDCSDDQRQQIAAILQEFHPWRKGPFDLFGIQIDTEWRSDWKWDRISPHIQPLQDRVVLDVGCGSGYHCWRMAGSGARLVVGIEPSQLSLMQFLALKRYQPNVPAYVLPLRTQDLPPTIRGFDTVFSMGILYHQRSPLDHLRDLFNWLRPGGELVLETLVIDERYGEILNPTDRYAKMRNVSCIPSCATLGRWLEETGYNNVRLVDVTVTTTQEQRSTPWMTFESLPDFLDPADSSRTIEGHPAPTRAAFIATVPS